MRVSILSLSALACLGASEPGVSPRDWTQERLDRVLAAVGKAPGSVEVVLTDAPDLSTASLPDRLELPRAAIALAPSTEAVDGLLAMLLSYAPEPKSGRNKLTPLSALAFGALVAGTGGASDPSTGRDSKIIPLGGQAAPSNDVSGIGQARAWRGARWHGFLGHCGTTQVEFLRKIGRPASVTVAARTMNWTGSAFARRAIADLGIQGTPSNETCQPLPDGRFEGIRAEIVRG